MLQKSGQFGNNLKCLQERYDAMIGKMNEKIVAINQLQSQVSRGEIDKNSKYLLKNEINKNLDMIFQLQD